MTEKPDEAASSGPTTDEPTQTDNPVAGGTGYPFPGLEPVNEAFRLSDEDRAEIESEHGRLSLEDEIEIAVSEIEDDVDAIVDAVGIEEAE